MMRKGFIFVVTIFLFAVGAMLSLRCSREQRSAPGEADTDAKDDRAYVQDTAQFITIACVGDIMMGSNFEEQPRMPPENGRTLLDSARNDLRAADITCGNLEGTLLDSGGTPRVSTDSTKLYIFRTPRAYAQYLVDAGFDFMNTANNHCADMGREGQESTIRTLDSYGLKHAGYASHPVSTMIVKEKKIGFASFAPHRGCADSRDTALVRRTIKGLKANCDIVIVSIHAGAEGTSQTRVPRKKEFFLGVDRGDVHHFAHTAVDAGADLVFGHGPHVPRGMEVYKDRLIAYSLGNFCTYRFAADGPLGYAPLLNVKMTSSGKFASGRILPFIQKRPGFPEPDKQNIVIPFLRGLTALDFPESPLVIHEDGILEQSNK